MNKEETHTVEIVVYERTVESLWFLAEQWECSVDEALERCVTEAVLVEAAG